MPPAPSSSAPPAQVAKPRPAKPRRLGRGLSSLLGDLSQSNTHNSAQSAGVAEAAAPPAAPSTARQDADRLRHLPLGDIAAAPHQPRKEFDEASLSRLAESIRHEGLVQPIVVRPAPPGSNAPWLLVAGERRLRAARLARLDPIPALIVHMPDRQAAEWALVENMQREDLNPMERAWGVRRLRDEFSLRQQDIADRLGLDRSTVANLLRLTDLEREIQAMLASGALSLGHGKALLAAPAGQARCDLARAAERQSWPVRRLEREAAALSRAAQPPRAPRPAPGPRHSLRAAARADLERRLSDALAADVSIRTSAAGDRGVVSIAFTDLEHFDALLKKLGVATAP